MKTTTTDLTAYVHKLAEYLHKSTMRHDPNGKITVRSPTISIISNLSHKRFLTKQTICQFNYAGIIKYSGKDYAADYVEMFDAVRQMAAQPGPFHFCELYFDKRNV